MPILVYGNLIKAGVSIGTRDSFSDIGATIIDYLGVDGEIDGKSFLNEILE